MEIPNPISPQDELDAFKNMVSAARDDRRDLSYAIRMADLDVRDEARVTDTKETLGKLLDEKIDDIKNGYEGIRLAYRDNLVNIGYEIFKRDCLGLKQRDRDPVKPPHTEIENQVTMKALLENKPQLLDENPEAIWLAEDIIYGHLKARAAPHKGSTGWLSLIKGLFR